MNQNKDIEIAQWAVLLESAQMGDREAFELFLRQAYPLIQRIVRSRVGSLADTDDITQECLIGVYRSLATYDPSLPVKPWLFGILRFKIADYFRKIGNRREQPQSQSMEDVTSSPEATNPLESRESLGQAQEALARLPDRLKRAITLTKVQGLDYEEAAKTEGITQAALRKRISRAYQQLAQALQRMGEDSFGD